MTAVLACHNRRELTLRCLESLFAQRGAEADVSAVLVDDGSRDGTAEVVRLRFPRVQVLRARGDLYWARAMALAERHAREARPDFLLWLNDDVVLEADALRCLLDTASAVDGPALVAGAVRDPARPGASYSGVRRRGFHPLRFDRVEPTGRPQPVDTFNGNVVLVSRDVYELLGGIDRGFAHSYADFDYGLRARAVGIRPLLATQWVGTCRREPRPQPWRDQSSPLVDRVRAFTNPRGGIPLRSHARYLRRHGGIAWPVFWVAPYARFLLLVVLSPSRRRMAALPLLRRRSPVAPRRQPHRGGTL